MKCPIEGWHSCSALCYRELCKPTATSTTSTKQGHCGDSLSYHHHCNHHHHHHLDVYDITDAFSFVEYDHSSFDATLNNNDTSIIMTESASSNASDDALETASLALVLAAAAAAATAAAATAAVSACNDTIIHGDTASSSKNNSAIIKPTVTTSFEKSLLSPLITHPLNQFKQSFHEIPLINMQNSLPDISKALSDACRNVGFFYITNHGISPQLREEVFALSRSFFANVTEAQKKRINNANSEKGLRGYFTIGQEDLNDKIGARDGNDGDDSGVDENDDPSGTTHQGDFKEGFDCGREESSNDVLSIFGRNLWPEVDDEENNMDENTKELLQKFRKKLLEYQNELLQLADKLLIAFASSLNLDDAQYFIKQSRDPMCTLRLLHYPPMVQRQQKQLETKQTQNQLGCGAHTDYGLFTILNQDNIGGLQILNGQGEWIKATPIPGTFVINVGDMMNRWTNGLYKSTIHRVVTNTSEKHRYSIPFFFNPDVDAVVEPLKNCSLSSSSSVTGFKTETAGDILFDRYKETFSHVKK